MRLLPLLLLMIAPLLTRAQENPGKELQRVVSVILVVDGDSIYNTFNDAELRQRFKKYNHNVKVIQDKDSIMQILSKHITTLLYIERDKTKKKN